MTPEKMFSVDLSYAQKVNWSLINAHIPLVFHLNVATKAAIDNVSLRISVKAWGKEYIRYERAITEIQPDKPFSVNNLTDQDFIWDFKKAAALPHSIPAILKLDLQADKTVYSVSGPIELLAYNEWHQAINDLELDVYRITANLPPGGHTYPTHMTKRWDGYPPLEAGVASLVFPNHKLYQDEAIDSQIQSCLEFQTSNVRVALSAYANGEPEQRKALIQAVYTMLLKNYRAFHTIEEISLEEESQAVRFPDRILPYRGNLFMLERLRSLTALREERKPGATCIDFVLMFCAILEHLGLRPLIIIVDNGRHAIAGCWMSDDNQSTFGKEIICRDKQKIEKLGGEKRIVGIDVTCYAQEGGLSYETAIEEGENYLSHSKEKGFVYAVDLQAARTADIRPLPLPPLSKPFPLWLIAIVVALIIGLWHVISPPPPPTKSLWELSARGSAELHPFYEKGFGEVEKCELEGKRTIISYVLYKGSIGCAVQFKGFDLIGEGYKTLIINAEEIPGDGSPKGFAIEFKSPRKAAQLWRFWPSDLGQDVPIPIPNIGKIGEITIVFSESHIGAGKGTIHINKFDFSPERRDQRKE